MSAKGHKRTSARASGMSAMGLKAAFVLMPDWPIMAPLIGDPGSNKEKQLWVTREKKTKARRNNKKRPCLIQRKNENRKKKRIEITGNPYIRMSAKGQEQT